MWGKWALELQVPPQYTGGQRAAKETLKEGQKETQRKKVSFQFINLHIQVLTDT
jgi:hypothetical protein